MNLTPTQQRIFDVLSDGEAHLKTELHRCLWDEENSNPDSALFFHISNLRKVIGSHGYKIDTRMRNGVAYYRLMRRICTVE